ncbi:MAG TPA: acyl-CoA dehydrogenase family protein, partial [Micromonosporaceae bacterium]
MPFDFTTTPRVQRWRHTIREFVRDVVIPHEQAAFAHGVTDDLRRELQAQARTAGIWAPGVAAELGGGGFALDEVAVLLEEAGTSLLGPLALNCAAPDEGNIHLLTEIATDDQRERYLRPLADGDVRSCFAMTEPPPGAGSDPSALTTTVTKVPGGYRISGDKTLITGADGAAFAIVMAADRDAGAAMLLVETGNPGFTVTGHVRTIDATTLGGHCRVRLDNAYVPDEAVLGEPGQGFRYAQVRLAPARLTHCMRWLGAARRAHETAVDRATGRHLFGAYLSEHGMAAQMIADNEIDLAAARALLWHACWQVARGESAGEAASRAKVFISE